MASRRHKKIFGKILNIKITIGKKAQCDNNIGTDFNYATRVRLLISCIFKPLDRTGEWNESDALSRVSSYQILYHLIGCLYLILNNF